MRTIKEMLIRNVILANSTDRDSTMQTEATLNIVYLLEEINNTL